MNKIDINAVSKKYDYRDMIDFVMRKYGIDDIELRIFEDLKMVNRFSNNELEIHAIMVSYIKKQYVMYVRPKCLTPEILFHEMTHLWQYYRGDLEMIEMGKKYIWKGGLYDCTTEYNDRPWEKEAFSNSYKLYKEYRKYKREQKKGLK